MSKHTPEPWTIDKTYNEISDVLGGDGFPVAEIRSTAVLPGYSEKFNRQHWAGDEGRSYIERPGAEVAANARLIAAAPEMYELLRAFANESGVFKSQFTERKQARALLAKIEGETP